ncbi:hypothetical protein BKI52_36165 [marine bacterium AO1-C]|nr:hypothetical protein BKI52_36165 [marine bacterium AO1-C]
MNTTRKITLFCFIWLSIYVTPVWAQVTDDFQKQLNQLKTYEHLTLAKVMVVGTNHFKKEVLNPQKQSDLQRLITALAQFKPTKVVVEWNPKKLKQTNEEYQKYLKGKFSIDQKTNEVYQIGFRLAKKMKHDMIWLFDNRPAFIGSLEGFTFEKFLKFADKNDKGFYDKHLKTITEVWNYNKALMKKLNLYDYFALINSSKMSKINAQRMHAFETRVGIQNTWMGPDWLGRWYQRNVRMMSNVLKMAKKGDRILIIVGDNHKWVLDRLFKNAPDFEVVPSGEHLLKYRKK